MMMCSVSALIPQPTQGDTRRILIPSHLCGRALCHYYQYHNRATGHTSISVKTFASHRRPAAMDLWGV